MHGGCVEIEDMQWCQTTAAGLEDIMTYKLEDYDIPDFSEENLFPTLAVGTQTFQDDFLFPMDEILNGLDDIKEGGSTSQWMQTAQSNPINVTESSGHQFEESLLNHGSSNPFLQSNEFPEYHMNLHCGQPTSNFAFSQYSANTRFSDGHINPAFPATYPIQPAYQWANNVHSSYEQINNCDASQRTASGNLSNCQSSELHSPASIFHSPSSCFSVNTQDIQSYEYQSAVCFNEKPKQHLKHSSGSLGNENLTISLSCPLNVFVPAPYPIKQNQTMKDNATFPDHTQNNASWPYYSYIPIDGKQTKRSSNYSSGSFESKRDNKRDHRLTSDPIGSRDYCECENQQNHGKKYPIPDDQDGDTDLLLAIKQKHFEKALQLITHYKDKYCRDCFNCYINVVNREQKAPIHYALYYKCHELLKQLLRYQVNLSTRDRRSNTVFHIIIETLDERTACWYLDEIFDKQYEYKDYSNALNLCNNDGFAPVHKASERGYKQALKTLVENGAQINKKGSQDGNSCVVKAAADGDWEMVQYLKEKLGACVNVEAHSNLRAIHYACMQNNKNAVIYLLSVNAELNIRQGVDGKNEGMLTSNEQIKDILSKEMAKRRRDRSRNKQKKTRKKETSQRCCECGSRQSVTYNN